MADADLAKLEEKQEAQLVELGRMQVALDSLKRKAGGAAGTVLGKISAIFEQAMAAAYPETTAEQRQKWLVVSACPNPKFGDYQCNSAMAIHKFLKDQGGDNVPKAPRECSQKIIECLPTNDMILKTEIAGPGFINAYLNKEWVASKYARILKTGPDAPAVPRQTVIVDLSSPNIAKEMHVGHLRSTIIGETLCRVFEFCGHRVHRINHTGDWGTQFGMLINHLKTAYPEFLDNPPNISDLTTFYKEAKKRFDEDEAFKKASQESVVTLQAGDEYSLKCWQILCDISRQQFKMVYDRLEVFGMVEKGESFYNSRMPGVVKELREKGLLEESDGALIMQAAGKQFPLMVQKRDGGYGYDTTDLTAAKYRLQECEADRVVYVTDAGQGEHFEMIFDGARQAGWLDPAKHRMDHVPFGLVLGDDKKKFKTRSGEVTKLVDLLDEAVVRSRQQLEERMGNEGGTSQMTREDLEEAARKIGYGCVKYADLRQHRITDYQFSYDKMLDLKGNTAVYLMYAYARIKSISAKTGVKAEDLAGVLPSVDHPKEYQLVLHVLKFPEVLERVMDGLLPHLMCEFLYQTAELFNDFYRDCKVVGDPLQNNRLVVCEGVAAVMKHGMFLLGITPLEKI
mmetsp:Transcript_8479/g.19993  ORF Transcript_8479/g.19993 Transcript_8479/m.19993 type:complete len:625 (-) Transcript_8479:153-2027(-)